MRRPISLTIAALALAFGVAAGPAQADSAPSTEQKQIKAVVVLIGANDYGLVPVPTRAAE